MNASSGSKGFIVVRPPLLKRIAYAAGFVAGIFILLALLLPKAAEYWIGRQGVASAHVGKFYINPVTGRVAFSANLADGADQKLKLDLGAVRMDWWTLFRRRIRLGKIAFQGISLDVERRADGGLVLGGLNIPASPKEEPAPPASSSKPWGLGVGSLDIQNVRVRYRDPLIAADVMVHNFHLDPVETWNPDAAAPFALDVTVNGGRIQATGVCKPFSQRIFADARLTVTDFPLAWLNPLLSGSGISNLAGAIGTRVDLKAIYRKESGELAVDYDGPVTFQGLRVRLPMTQSSVADAKKGSTGAKRKDDYADISFDGTFQIQKLALELPGRQDSEEAAPPKIKAESFSVAPGARIGFVDGRFHPPLRLNVSPFAANFKNIDTTDVSNKTQFDLSAYLGKFDKIELSGEAAPLAALPEGNLKLKISNVNLPLFSAYTERFLGYRLKSGLLDLGAEGRSKRGSLDVSNDLVLNKLELERLKSDEQDEFTQTLGLPLNTMLSLLRDKNDDIKLSVPVSGSVEDPKVGVGPVVMKLVQKAAMYALQKAAENFFPPLKTAETVASVASFVLKLRFDPLLFNAGQAELTPEALDYVDKVGQKLADRPGVRLNVCGFVNAADAQALKLKISPAKFEAGEWSEAEKEKLSALAFARAQKVRDYWVEKFGIDPKRLFVCAPAIGRKPAEQPRVEISL